MPASNRPLHGFPRPLYRQMEVEGPDVQGNRHRTSWSIAEETPVEIGFNGRPWVVMLASPGDLEDLAVGLSYSEGVVTEPGKIRAIQIAEYPEGITANVTIDPQFLTDRARRSRTLEGHTGCGLCGVETLADTIRQGVVRTAPPRIDDQAVAKALRGLRERQPLNEITRSVHGAAWCSEDGEILLVREDVGRHNALDKLIGSLLRTGTEADTGFIAMSSRCSMELIQKTAAIGAPLLATISAPTHRALELAVAAGVSVRCAGPDGAIMSFNLEKAGAEN